MNRRELLKLLAVGAGATALPASALASSAPRVVQAAPYLEPGTRFAFRAADVIAYHTGKRPKTESPLRWNDLVDHAYRQRVLRGVVYASTRCSLIAGDGELVYYMQVLNCRYLDVLEPMEPVAVRLGNVHFS